MSCRAPLHVQIKKLRETAQIPTRMSESAAGYDLYADIPGPGKIFLDKCRTKLIPTGIAIAFDSNDVEAQIRIRSSLSKNALLLANGVGTVDADYRGELFIAIYNGSENFYVIETGDRIAQLIFSPIIHPASFEVVEELPPSLRGEGGFGSTGK